MIRINNIELEVNWRVDWLYWQHIFKIRVGDTIYVRWAVSDSKWLAEENYIELCRCLIKDLNNDTH